MKRIEDRGAMNNEKINFSTNLLLFKHNLNLILKFINIYAIYYILPFIYNEISFYLHI